MTDRRFIVKKYVMAKNVADAFKREKNVEPDEVYIDPKWKDDKKQEDMGYNI